MNKFHHSFQLNGHSFASTEALLSYAKGFSDSLYSFFFDWFSSEDCVVVQTSGSTGKPKPIQLKKEFMIHSAKATGVFFDLKENTTALLCLSADYIAGKMMLVRALTLGWHLDVVEPVSNPLKNIQKVYEFSAMVPLQLQHSVQKLDKIKKLIIGGGVVSSNLHQKIQKVTTEIFATYGMTETVTHIAVKKLNHLQNSSKINAQQKSFYKTLPNITIYKDERSCLVISAPKIADNLIVTNDVVAMISDQQFEWLGRFDNVINSGGVKLHPEKIEIKFAKIIKERFFVAPKEDEQLGQRLILIVEGKSKTFDFSELQDVSKYEIPKEVYFLDKFVETETKKIQRLKTLDLLNL